MILILCLIILTATIARTQEAPETRNAEKDRIEAERLWEQMVKVKGGRERLYSISNMMLTKGNKVDDVQMQLYVYPNKYWEWNKGIAFHNTLWIKMANLDLGVFFVADHSDLLKYEKDLSAIGRADYREGYLMEACAFLLETKWLKPTPNRVRQQIVGKQKLDVIETDFTTLEKYRNWRLDFYIDPESLVVQGVEHYGDDGKSYSFYSFGRYTTVDGIQVPLEYVDVYRVSELNKASLTPLTFQFNVDYDQKVFERPPSAEAGPDAWKPKAKP